MDVDFPLQALVAVDLQSWPTLNSCDIPGIMMSPPLSQLHVDSMAWVPQEPPKAESIQLFIEDQAVSPSHDLAPPPYPPPTPVSKLSLFLSLPECRRPSFQTGEMGGGGVRRHILRRRDILVLNKSFNTLWPWVYSKYVRRHVQLCTYCTLNKDIKFVTRFSTNMDIGQDIPEHHTVCTRLCTKCALYRFVAALFINLLL